jgi:molybdenum cofactor cytidylyltransferase
VTDALSRRDVTDACTALAVETGECLFIVGAGGKTSLVWALARGLHARGRRVLVTTTTRMAEAEIALFPAACAFPADAALPAITAALAAHGCVFAYAHIGAGKAHGLTLDALERLVAAAAPDVVLVEADGARGAALKLPFAHEPVVAASLAGLRVRAVVVAGWSAVGRPIAACYNADGVRALLDAAAERAARDDAGSDSAVLDPAGFAQVVTAYADGLAARGLPVTCVINGTAGADARHEARWPENAVDVDALRVFMPPSYPIVPHAAASYPTVFARLNYRTGEETVFPAAAPVAAVILAAGLSSRMGRQKALLPWVGDRPLIAHLAHELAVAFPHPDARWLVVGHNAGAVEAAACEHHPLRVVFNPDYASGEMLGSLQAGLRALPQGTAAVMVVLGDQPFFTADLARRVLDRWQHTGAPVVAPSYARRRGHPILFTRPVIEAVLALPAGAAPRDAINLFAARTAYVELDGLPEGDRILYDVDTPDAYAQARAQAGLPPLAG